MCSPSGQLCTYLCCAVVQLDILLTQVRRCAGVYSCVWALWWSQHRWLHRAKGVAAGSLALLPQLDSATRVSVMQQQVSLLHASCPSCHTWQAPSIRSRASLELVCTRGSAGAYTGAEGVLGLNAGCPVQVAGVGCCAVGTCAPAPLVCFVGLLPASCLGVCQDIAVFFELVRKHGWNWCTRGC